MKSTKKKSEKKRTPAAPGNVRPNSLVPWAPKGTHAGGSSLASTGCHCLLPKYTAESASAVEETSVQLRGSPVYSYCSADFQPQMYQKHAEKWRMPNTRKIIFATFEALLQN